MKMIAHRGYSKYELENTKEAFLAAANRSYFGIETDITLLKDRSMVLFHDDDLKRLANSDNLIRNMNFKEAMRVELIAKGTYHTYNYHIATPLEYLRICKHYNKYPVIELKWGFDNEAVDKLMELLLEEDMFDKSMIICYTMSTILYLKEKYPDKEVSTMNKYQIILKTSDETTDLSKANKYTLENEDGYITVFKYNKEGKKELVEKTSIQIKSLPKSVQEELKEAIVLDNEEDAYSRLEDFGS